MDSEVGFNAKKIPPQSRDAFEITFDLASIEKDVQLANVSRETLAFILFNLKYQAGNHRLIGEFI
ncbi:hypothetical protein GCM10010916_49010 [Paenibacillus abyssi]|uniref:Uncharacterized protein n=1 Tax=Paenibacillus abyssi TaxID=1340531 RepID=A0A917LIH8_9BACL|nr:hypothetical protein GCM10010916_49010 [Paenibacillus abyssi]